MQEMDPRTSGTEEAGRPSSGRMRLWHGTSSDTQQSLELHLSNWRRVGCESDIVQRNTGRGDLRVRNRR